MTRSKFIALIALATVFALPVHRVHAQATASASDATTPMDKKVGNEDAPTDDTLSNAEVKQLATQQKTTGQMHATGGLNTKEGTPAVSGTTPIYKDKGGSAAKTENGN